MAGPTDNFLLDAPLRQPFLRAEREESNDKLFVPVAVAPSELDISPLSPLLADQISD
jgi:hypothetical protein